MTTFDEATDRATRHVVESLARQDARSPRDAALASLGPAATEEQIADWCARFRPEVEHSQTG